MGKIIFQFLVLLLLFFGSWLGLSKVGIVKDDELAKLGRENAKKLGKLMLESIERSHPEVVSREVNLVLDSIKARVCKAAGISEDTVQLHLFRSQEVNAFALPGSHIVIFSGLVSYARNPEEVAGVISHELGHIQKSHIERRLIKEVGLSMLFVLAGGNEGQEILRQVVHSVSSTSFDRSYESEADLFAVETMVKANIDPEHLSNFMFRIAQENKVPEELIWLSTHPDCKDRAADILKERRKHTITTMPVVNTSWENVKNWIEDL